MPDYLLISMPWWFFSCLGRHFKEANFASQNTQLTQIPSMDLCQSININVMSMIIFFMRRWTFQKSTFSTKHTINSNIFVGFMSKLFIDINIDVFKSLDRHFIKRIFIKITTSNSNIFLGSMPDYLLISISWWFF